MQERSSPAPPCLRRGALTHCTTDSPRERQLVAGASCYAITIILPSSEAALGFWYNLRHSNWCLVRSLARSPRSLWPHRLPNWATPPNSTKQTSIATSSTTSFFHSQHNYRSFRSATPTIDQFAPRRRIATMASIDLQQLAGDNVVFKNPCMHCLRTAIKDAKQEGADKMPILRCVYDKLPSTRCAQCGGRNDSCTPVSNILAIVGLAID